MTNKKPKVVIAANLTKTKVFINKDGSTQEYEGKPPISR